MSASDVLLWQAGIVFALMVALGLLKHRTRSTKLHGYTKRMARRRGATRPAAEPQDESDNSDAS